MSEFIAGAFVDVKPETKGFRAELKRKVDDAIKNSAAFKIPVELDPKRFKSTVAAAARQSPAKIPIVPGTSVVELRKSIKDKIDRATTGLKITVPIEVKQTGTSPAAAQSRSTRGTAGGTGTDAVDKANKRATKSTKQLTEAQRRQATVDAIVKKSKADLAVSTRLFAQANEANVSSEERAQRLTEARAASTRAAKGANDLLATSEANLTVKQKSALENRVALAQTMREDITRTKEKVAANKAATAVESKSADAREKSAETIAFEAKEIKDLNSVHLKENELLAAEAALKRQTTAARKLGLTSIAQENEEQLALIATQKKALADQRSLLKGDTARTRSQKTAGRGAASAILSLLGIRGATLASSASFLAGAAAAAIFTKSVKQFADLETELNVFQATAGATATQMQEVAKAAHDLGVDVSLPGVNASDAAKAMSELARAGLGVRDSIAGARGVLQLSAAAQISNADAAALAASALNAFSLSGEDAVHVADLLANAANNAQGDISEMGAALQQASAIAHLVGLSLEDTVATLTIFARHGLRGSDAGTSLRTALSRLIAPTHKAAEVIDELGLKVRDANGNIRADVFAQFGEATKDLTPALRDMIAETIAGQDAIRAFAIGAGEGRRGLKLAQLQMEAEGTAANLAAARSKGLAGSFAALASNAETLGTSIGAAASGPLKLMTDNLNDLLTTANQLATLDFSGFGKSFFSQDNPLLLPLKFSGPTGVAVTGALKLIGQGSDDTKKKVQSLRQQLTDLQNLRVAAFAQKIDIGPITAKVKALQVQLRQARADAGEFIPVTKLEKQLKPFEDIYDQAQRVRKALVDQGKDTTFIDKIATNALQRMNELNAAAYENAKKTKESIKKGLSGATVADALVKEFALISQTPALATPEVLASFAKQIESVRSVVGSGGKRIAQALLVSLNDLIAQAVKDDNSDLAQDLRALGLKIPAIFAAGVADGFKNIKVPLTDQQLEDALLPARIKTARAEAFGTVSDQIAAKQGELDRLNAQLGEVVKGSEQEENILGKIAATKGAIRGLREQQASDQKEKDTASDKKVAAALSGRERTLTQALEKAQATETLKDDLRRERDLRAFYAQEIKTIRRTVKDAETRQQQVEEAEDNLFKIEQQIAEDRAGRRAQLRDLALKPIDAGVERASETETLKDDVKQANRKVRFWQTQVRNLKELVKQRRATGSELQVAQDALDDAEKDAREARKGRKQQVIDDREQALQLDIDFAQTTENKGKELRARNAFIAFLEQQKKHFKGNVLKLKELRNQIAEQRKAIKDLKGETEKSKGTTVFELLQQNAETFKANAGNLISGNQPFAGPAGFTADVAQFLIRQKKAAADAKAAAKSSSGAGGSGFDGLFGSTTFANFRPGLASIDPSLRVSRGGGALRTPSSTDTIKRADFSALTGAVVKLTNVMERQPGTGKTSTTSARREPNRSGRVHYSVATAARRVVEERTGI